MRFSGGPGSHFGPGAFPEDGATIVAGVVIETLPGRALAVSQRLGSVDGLDLVGGDEDRKIAAVWTAPSGRELLRAVEELVRGDEDVLGVFPTFIGCDDEEER